MYRMAGNIGGEFNLADWRMSGRSAKFKSAKYFANTEFVPSLPYMVLGTRRDRFAFAVFTKESYIPHRKGGRRGNSWRKASPKRRREVKQRRARVNLYTGTGTRYPAPPTPRSQLSRSAELKSANLQKLAKMMNPPNLIPAKFSGHTV